MKKFGLLKTIGRRAAAICACTTLLATCATALPVAAFADEADPAPAVSATEELAKGKFVKSEYKYGETIDLTAYPAGATVILPDGNNATVTGNKVVADQLGVYKLHYEKGGIKYDYKINVTLDEDYFLYVKHNGASIPTYVEAGTKFTLPDAWVKYYDDKNVMKNYPGDYTVEITDSLGGNYTTDKTFDTTGKSGKVFVTYTARLGATGTKYFSKTFTVNIQSKVNKKGNPTLAVSGIQRDASVNRPYTLPVATVSDNNDENIQVVIEVTDPHGNKVKNVKVNDDGYAYETEADEVEFDNDKSMTFYPTEVGDYKVSYTAYNDFYDENNPAAGGKSSTSEATIKVADHVAPVFKNVEEYEYLIPETWGMAVKNENGSVNDLGGKIVFKIPQVVDNLDTMYPEEGKDNKISIYFRVTDSDNNVTVLTISDILADGDNGKFTKNDTYTADASFNKETGEFKFDFANYAKKVKGETASKPGTYTVLFRARDKANNTSSKTYTINLKDVYEDAAKPTTAEVNAPDYLSGADEEFTIPHPVYSDASDTRPQLTYKLYSKVEGGAITSIDVKGGETAKLVKADDGALSLDVDGKTLALGNKLYYYVAVKDKVGNFRSNAIAEDKSFIDVPANDTMFEKIEAVTTVVDEKVSGNFTLNADTTNIRFAKANGTGDIKAGDNVTAGSFTITAVNEDMRYYTGFEVAVYDPNGDFADVTLVTLSDVKDSTTTIYVKDITFNASLPTGDDGYYTLIVRAFDVNGNTEVKGFTLDDVKANSIGGGSTSATTTIGATGNVNVKYKLHNSVINNIPGEGTYRVVRKISGGIFSVMGNELIAKTAGSYRIQDGYIDANVINNGSFDYNNDVNFAGVNKGIHDVYITNSEKPAIELLGKMPTYVAKYDDSKELSETNGLVKIARANAVTPNGMGEVKVEVLDPNGSDDVDFNKENYTFRADKDGVYTVKYTATYENGEKNELECKITCGDVEPPKFSLELGNGTATGGSVREGATFAFKNMVLLEGESNTGVTVTKEIFDPSHELMSANTVSGSFSGYAAKANNGTEITLNKVGEYTVVYTAKDDVGNDYKITETITVTSPGSSSPSTWTGLSTALIIIAVVLLAGVIVYVVRFRKVKK